jgi:hypothetical protein
LAATDNPSENSQCIGVGKTAVVAAVPAITAVLRNAIVRKNSASALPLSRRSTSSRDIPASVTTALASSCIRRGFTDVQSTLETWEGSVQTTLFRDGTYTVEVGPKHGPRALVAKGNVDDREDQ